MDKNKSIGVFDSGVGGLSVLKNLVDVLPNEDYIYFGDTARVPYGEKSKEQIIEFVSEILNWYKSNHAKAVIMACNTSSAVVSDVIKNEYDFPIFGLIRPTAKYISGLKAERIGVIATSATVRSKAFTRMILELDSSKKIFEIACPNLVEIVEAGKADSEEAKILVNNYLVHLLENKAEKIVLGCTHYPFLSNVINQITNKPEMLIDPAKCLAKKIITELERLNLINKIGKGSRKYFVSANPSKFVEVGKNFYADCREAEEINLQ
ncbi:MAG: glutamate racemase [bacterium]